MPAARPAGLTAIARLEDRFKPSAAVFGGRTADHSRTGGIWRIGSITAEGYRSYNHEEKFCVWITGQLRRVPPDPLRNEAPRRRRAGIGHLKAEHRMSRNYLKGRDGDRANAELAAAGYNFALLLRWFRRLLCALFQALFAPLCPGYLKNHAKTVLHGRHQIQEAFLSQNDASPSLSVDEEAIPGSPHRNRAQQFGPVA